MTNPLLLRRSHLPFFIELIASTIARLLYRVRTSGAENLPTSGGVLIIAVWIDIIYRRRTGALK